MSQDVTRAMLDEIAGALNFAPAISERVAFSGDDRLPSCFPVTELAAASIGAACLAVSELLSLVGPAPRVTVDARLASLWFGFSIRPQGWELPSAWDAITGDYRAQDGWIKLHTNAPHHKAAALSVLGCEPLRESVSRAVAGWSGEALEEAIVGAGGCAARLRDRAEWLAHPQGEAVRKEPLIRSDATGTGSDPVWRPGAEQPLAGLRVLDLTRVLAGPVATRFLAGYGAEVLRIDPPGWDEPGVVPEVTLGKRCARLDLDDAHDRRTFERLLGQADIFVHGYRADALERLGFGFDQRQAIRPGLIDVSLDAYGHSGPWATRRGFDSLVQFSCGIGAAGMAWKRSDLPVSLPVQALDQATGYLIAASAVRGVIARTRGEAIRRFRVSLARTAELLFAHQSEGSDSPFGPVTDNDFADVVEMTSWGPAHRIRAPALIADVPMRWPRPAAKLGNDQAVWMSG